jgi:hypothetical protein
MKTINRLVTTGAIVAMLALPALAKSVTSTELALQDPCTEESKTASYQAFVDTRKTDQDKAYESAKKYLACPTEGATEATQKIIEYLKKWVTAYEDLKEKQKFPDLLYNQRKYPEAYELGAKLLTKDPENLKVLVDLGANGYLVQGLKNPTLNAEAIKDAKKALALLESGKTVEQWTPLSGKDEAMAYLNYTIGVFTVEQDPSGALKNLIKAAQFETPLKKSPQTYAYIAGAYDTGPYAKQSEEYTQKFGGKDETPESKLAVANINQVVDRVIDGYARAVALATDPKLATQKAAWQARLAELYKYRFKSEAGMNEFIAGVLSKPLPPEPTPLTSLPSEPTTAPIGTSGAATTSTTGTSTASTTANGAAKPGTAKTTTPAGPAKPKNN